ncbi:MAG: NBR1-Ig-like domain-containing protein [Chloroflexota bacterium]
MRNASFSTLLTLLVITALTLTGCNMPAGAGSADATPDVTQAYQTVMARLTEAAGTQPAASATPNPTQTPAPSNTAPAAAPTNTQPVTAQPTTAARQCDQAAAGSPIDVTIPDDTRMTPGQSFTKTWRLLNAGTCTWTRDYTIALFSGDQMGSTSGVRLPNDVAPGGSVDVSVDLVAPAAAGSYRGDWKLRNAAGNWFGIGPSASSTFWVKIVVAGGTPGTITPTVTGTPGTPYPGDDEDGEVLSGSAGLLPNEAINLDNGGTGASGDLLYRLNSQDLPVLDPQGVAGFAVMAYDEPSYQTCRSAGLGSSTIQVTSLQEGMYICYVTDQGLYGWLYMRSLNTQTGRLKFDYNTWLNP